MLTRWNDLENTLFVMDDFRRRMNRLLEGRDWWQEQESLLSDAGVAAWPRVRLHDTGNAVVLRAELPGLSEEDVKLQVYQEVLTISGERKLDVPAGFGVHRQERPSVKFSRSFALGCKVDLEKISAVMKHGVLTVTLPKAPESQPRQISVKVN